jgi:hypothetical protein
MHDSKKDSGFEEDFPSESRTDRLRIYRNIILYGVLIPGIGISLLYLGTAYNAINYSPSILMTNIYRFLGVLVVTLIISLPLLYLVNSKYREGELSDPNDLKYKECNGTLKNQCKICKRHPVSKKYHIKNFHNKKDEKVKDYFVACGCLKCQNWTWPLSP